MFEYVLMLLLFLGVIAVTALIFVAWMVFTLVRMVLRGIVSLFTPSSHPSLPMPRQGIVCTNRKCQTLNVNSASFCRRCGGELPQAQRVDVRRVAML